VTGRLLLRADGGTKLGVGHLGRCLALGEAWRDSGGSVTLCSADPPGMWADRFRREGVDVVEPGAMLPPGDWAVADGYGFTEADVGGLRSATDRLLVLADRGFGPGVAADLVLDQNLGADGSGYAERYAGARLLLGERYAMLRREFRVATPRPDRGPGVRRVLVSVGGGDGDAGRDLTGRIRADDRLAGIEVVTLTGSDDVTGIMVGVDLAVAAAGTTVWELCCLAVPAVLFAIAANQLALVEGLVATGVAGGVPELNPDATVIADELVARINDPVRRRQGARKGRDLIDGQGAARVVAAMRS
jgi:spore coat polysaccharide biosynthesis predicted glycosyltransferase SpsG